MHTDILISMLCDYQHAQLNGLIDKAAQDARAVAVGLNDCALQEMLPIVDALKESNDLVLKRAFLLVTLTLSATLQQWCYNDAPNCVLSNNVYTTTRVVSKYTQRYLNFQINETDLVRKVLSAHCVA